MGTIATAGPCTYQNSNLKLHYVVYIRTVRSGGGTHACLGQLGSSRDLDLRSNFEVDIFKLRNVSTRLTRETRW